MGRIRFNFDQETELTKGDKSASPSTIRRILNYDIQLFGNDFSDKIKEKFYSELVTLLSSGIDLRNTLDLIIEGEGKSKIKRSFEEIKDRLVEGYSFSEAIQLSRKFSNFEVYSIEIGEETGKLANVLQDLNSYFSRKIKFRRQILSAISYPLIIIVASILAIVFMLQFVVPMFKDIFARHGSDLPSITVFVLDLSSFISSYFYFFFLFLFVIISLHFLLNNNNWYRNLTSKIILKMPIVGILVKRIYLARLSQSFALLMSSKVSLLYSIELLHKMITFYPIQDSLIGIRNAILSGKHLHEGMKDYSIYPDRMIALIKVAEEVNQLDPIFQRMADQYNEEINHQTNLLNNLLEPIIIFGLGIIITIILVAMYLPMFQLGTQVMGS